MTTIALGGFLLGAAIVTTGTANAEQVDEGGRQVVFAGGGMLGLSCRSTPSVDAMTVPAESTVRVVNRTGHGARLLLNGASRGSIPDDGATEVVFRRGTTAVTLDPTCAVPDQATPVLVTATPSSSPTPVPSSSSASGGAVNGGTGTPSGTPASSQPGSGTPTATQRPGGPGLGLPLTAPPGRSRPTLVRDQAEVVGSLPQGGATSRVKTKLMRGTAGADVPAFSGMPPGSDKKVLPGVPTMELTPTEAAPALGALPAPEVAAAEPVAAMRPMGGSRPIGLLAVVAMVCAAGVAVGAIRAFVSQRASRASVA
ncbi:hypothetical protein Asp14428_47500 [Actinoplanes sp. NBRC 14428]|nr:hypothetical protein [Pseudosporangium ferrugineum]BCJ53275.1 hypothetical protein Asp14428_47500 [Actinoplanes sp. NBRC 14428]